MMTRFASCCVLAIMFCLMSVIPGRGAVTEYSNWTQSLSGLTDDASYGWFDYDSFKMVVSGQNVHVVWRALRTDYGEKRLNYRRSTDGGKTFGTVQMLATGIDIIFDSSWQGLAVDGNTVHVVYQSGWPSSLKYLRSTDNGANFEAVKKINDTGYSSYTGVYMVAANGVVTVALADNKAGNAGGHKDVRCIYSNDGGVTFESTTIAHSDPGQATPIYEFGVEDMIRSGANIYILYSVQDINWYTSEGRLYLVSSNNGGVTFNPPQRVTVASSNGGYYRNTIQNQHYSTNLATVGNNVYVTWVNTEVNNFDNGASTYTTRFRRSSNKGLTLEDPITLLPSPTSNMGSGGQETIVASGSNVYIVSSYLNDSTYFWRSTDSGSSFEPPQKISNGGWWPTLLLDPNDSAKLHIANGYYVTSTDSGATFNGVVALPPSTLSGQTTPILAVGNDGVVHWAATYSRYDMSSTQDIYYRRLAPAPNASGAPKVLTLVTDSTYRRDNMQIAATPDINLASAMTIEYWVKMDFQGDPANNWSHFQIEVAKKRASGYGSYEIGYWNGFSGFYGRLVTEDSPNQNSGDMIFTNIVPKDLTWYHVAMTYNSTAGADNWKIYVDGVLATSVTYSGKIVLDNLPLVLGPDFSGVKGTLQFGDFRIWNRARSAAEIAADMNRTLDGNEPGLTAYYTFSDTTRDMTGRGNDGVLMFKEGYVSSPIPSRIKQLTLSFAGSGGQVNGDMACVSDGICDPVMFSYESHLELTATPDTNSTFGSWSGCTSVSGTTCNVTMDAEKTVTVTFVASPPVKILGRDAAGFATLRSAYNAASSSTDIIQIRSLTLPDPPITFDRPVSVTIKGGYDASFSPSNSGVSTIQGPVIIKYGPVTVEKLAVK